MTESGKFRGVRPESGIETPEYRHSGVDFDYFLGELNQLNTQIEHIQSALERIKEPDISKDPGIIASFWEKMAPEIQKKEEERKKLLGRIGIFQAIILEFDKPENGMPKALANVEQHLEGKRDPDKIADEIKAIAAARDEIDNNMGALHDNVRDAETHIQHVQAQIKEVGKAMDKNARLQEIKNKTGLTKEQRLAEVEHLMDSDRVLGLKIRQRHEYENRELRYEKHLQEYEHLIMEAEKQRKAGFRKQSELKEEYSVVLELLLVKEAIEKRIGAAHE
jgi:hypothetical protein